MTFSEQFAQQKIPEWQGHYVDYPALRQMIEDFSEKEKKGKVCKLPGIYYYSMPMQQPVALSFDLVKKYKKSISAIEAAEKFRRQNSLPFQSIEAELRDLKSSQKQIDIESSDNVELDSEGNQEGISVVKKSFEFDEFVVTV